MNTVHPSPSQLQSLLHEAGGDTYGVQQSFERVAADTLARLASINLPADRSDLAALGQAFYERALVLRAEFFSKRKPYAHSWKAAVFEAARDNAFDELVAAVREHGAYAPLADLLQTTHEVNRERMKRMYQETGVKSEE